MRIAICDDQIEYRQQAESAVRECLRGTDLLVDTFADGPTFLQGFARKPYDLVFLDIEMPKADGITVAKKLREHSKDVPIVFLTSHIEFALVGYEVNALRYLTKPLNRDKLQEVLTFVLEQMREQRTLWIKNDLCEKKLLIKDIFFMESQNQNVLIATATDSYSVRYNLSDYELELKEDSFYRIHRGYLVSLRHIKRIGNREVEMADGTVLPVSRAKEKSLKDALFQYIRKESL